MRPAPEGRQFSRKAESASNPTGALPGADRLEQIAAATYYQAEADCRYGKGR